jgi:hypothetical protein
LDSIPQLCRLSLASFDRATTFPDKTEHRESVLEIDSWPLVEENLQCGRNHETRPELTSLLDKIVKRRKFRQSMRTALENSPVRPLAPALLAVRDASAPSRGGR